jgi:serine/threonine protein kinase
MITYICVYTCLWNTQVLGRGSFGKVMQVRKKSDGKIYAMKILRKKAIIERNQACGVCVECVHILVCDGDGVWRCVRVYT